MRSRAFGGVFFAVAIAAALASCRELEVAEPFPCSTAGNCPSPYHCIDHMCRLSPLDGGAGASGRGGGAGGGSSGMAGGGAGGSVGGGQAGRGGSGGSAGTGGSTGGSAGTGGSTGGSAGTGGSTGGSAGTAGVAGRGGTSAAGGTGGIAGSIGGTGGVAGTGGMPGGRGGGGAGGTGGSGGAPLADGQPCTAGMQCQSTYCVDSVCCESTCTGACAACSMAKTNQASGRCRPIPDGQNPDNECTATGTATCSGSTLTPAAACNGANACRPGTPGNCPGGFACAASGSACRTSCAASTDCAGGYYCNQNVCVVKKGVGVGCGNAGECTSGACVDSVCCSSQCALGVGTAGKNCMGCAAATTGAQDGTCAARQGATTRACPTTNPTACVNLQTDPDNCGTCGRVCPSSGAPPGTTRACLYGGCDFKCNASGVVLYTSPNAVRSCRKSVWDFENPDTSLIGIDGWGNSNETLIRRLNMPNSGNWSAGLYSSDLDMYPAYTDYYFREPPNNDLGYVDVRGKTFSAYVYVAAQTPVATDYCRLQGSTSTAPYEYFFAQSTATKMQPPANQWFELKGTFGTTSMETQIQGMWIMCKLPTSWANDESKLWFVDDISIY